MASNQQQLCWSCKNACGKCSWSAEGKPIAGWTAESTEIWMGYHYTASYYITECPDYKWDGYTPKNSKQLAQEIGVSLRTYQRLKKEGKLERLDGKRK